MTRNKNPARSMLGSRLWTKLMSGSSEMRPSARISGPSAWGSRRGACAYRAGGLVGQSARGSVQSLALFDRVKRDPKCWHGPFVADQPLRENPLPGTMSRGAPEHAYHGIRRPWNRKNGHTAAHNVG